MKRTTLTTLLLLTLSLSAYGASALYPYPANWSFGDLADWAMPKIALATDTLPPIASAAVGDIVILTNPASNTMGVYQWQLWMAAPPDGDNLATWSWSMIYQPSVSASMTEHINATGTSVHGLGTMSLASTTDYVATDTFAAHTGNISNPHSVTYSQVGAEPAGAVATHAALTDAHGVSKVAGVEDLPNNASFTLAGLSEHSYSNLTDKPEIPNNASFTLSGLSEHSYTSLTDLPTFGSMASETATDYLKASDLPDFSDLSSAATGNATFSYTFDVATLTVGGVDVLGDVHSALAAIIGE